MGTKDLSRARHVGYSYYKGAVYERVGRGGAESEYVVIISLVTHRNTGEQLVVYEKLKPAVLDLPWAMPRSEFEERVEDVQTFQHVCPRCLGTGLVTAWGGRGESTSVLCERCQKI